ncbi:hypothetical protein [Cryptosporidium parvum Iowa II]|uniref:Uncharacterized protein n=2 Tax=Cryptosporidium parvum TaxID=5807 RepID=Q5CTP2_CRYPI|nr:hypothetical protein [Cryptosporidium parvum Iowa II]EAK88774.1 hypothetical protein cgd2_2220 [Cryptosporidium parvum Iowa II]QOY43011.1 Uncharacterized protein CPATCC_0028590 [Cryptosporidium parvum]WKS76518.1 hypothetical protein CPCDC_2g2220 [Cryptosporidium sp. 43IA8]WRK31011.1 Uncharacterized protein cpbgf_2002220 [Cryptosporidium parvum]|eukprot:QOY43011.1 hypothetical protein CPATCC_000710 [Cryptosporidium parvum]
MNKTISSDNLKDAVRKWHAKRKKDSNNQANSENTGSEPEGIFGTKKHDVRHISAWSHNNFVESNQLSHFTNEQKRPRPTVIENNIKYIFDGPLSFDTIMALKRKKSNVIFSNNEKILNNPNIEQNDSKSAINQCYTHQTNNSQVMDNFKDEINIIYSKSISAVQNFFKISSMSEVINLLEYILNFLSFSTQELISRYNKKAYFDRHEKSLGICINFILNKSNLTDEQFDETSLEYLAKYPKVFESLKTLTKINGLNDTVPSEISNHIQKLNSQIDKIYNLLLNR